MAAGTPLILSDLKFQRQLAGDVAIFVPAGGDRAAGFAGAIVAVLEDPVLQGDNLTYTVKILQGDMPAKGADVSVFIDIIGRPLTPMSYAGVARRSYRRAYYY